MKKYVLLLLIAVGFSLNIFAQEIYKNEKYGFSILQPENWFKITDKNLDYNLQGVHGWHTISFSKNNVFTFKGLNPIISINVGNNYMQFKDFSKTMLNDKTWRNKDLLNVALIQKPEVIEVDGQRCIVTFESYDLKQNGLTLKLRKKSFMIPFGKHLFYIDFVDGQQAEDESILFEEVIKSLKFRK